MSPLPAYGGFRPSANDPEGRLARHEHLPIYKAALAVAVDLERQVAGFSRYHKYTLGTDLRNRSRHVVDGHPALSDSP